MIRRFDVKASQQNGPMLALAGLLLVGLVIGLFVGWLWTRVDQDGLREEDYYVMVSLLYERERSLPAVEERLAVLGQANAAGNLIALSESYPKAHPEALTEARALRQLAAVLAKPTAETKNQPTSSTESSEASSGGVWVWLGMALVLVCILGIGGPFALRFASSAHRGFALPWQRSSRRSKTRFDPRTIKKPMIQSNLMRTIPQAPRSKVTESRPVWQDAHQEVSTVQDTTGQRFSSSYEFGEDPFDEIHPVIDKATGELIGACGLSAELKLSDEFPGRYYAFSVWTHDYVGGGRLQAIGIVSKWAKSNAPEELIRWTESGKATEIVAANPGMRLFIDTTNLAVDVNISGFRYGSDAKAPQDSYFSSLTVSFDVKVKTFAQI